MPKQLTLATQADGGFERHRKPTRRDIFLAEMDQVVPWAALCALIEPFYPKPRADGGGRPVVGLERMLRIHFLQQWYALSDPAVEEALYDSAAMRRFVGIDLGRESAPDETTVCKFRHLLEKHGLAERVFEAVSQHLRDQGLQLSQGTIVDATILGAPSSTKNRAKARDPQMHQTPDGQAPATGSVIAATIACGYTYQGQPLRRILVALHKADDAPMTQPLPATSGRSLPRCRPRATCRVRLATAFMVGDCS